MDVALLIVSFLCFGVGVAGGLAAWNLGTTCRALDLVWKENINKIHEDAGKLKREADAEKAELKVVIEALQKVHNARVEDLKPLRDELESLRLKVASASAMGMPRRG